MWNDFRRDRRELIDFARENLDVQRRCQPATELVAVTDQRHSKAQASDRSKKADNCSLTKEHPDNLRNVRPESFHNSDLVPLLYRYGDERAHDSESRHDHDEEQKEEHHRAFQPHRFEILAIHIDPGLGVLRRLEELLDLLFHAFGAVWVVGLHRDSVQRVVQIMAGLKNAGDSQFFRKNHIAQFVDCFFLFFALRVLQFLNGVEDLAEIARRINCHLIADADSEFSRQLNPEHRRFSFQVELAEFDELLEWNDFLFLLGINTANQRCKPPVVEFYNHRSLHKRGRGDYARRFIDFGLERAPLVEHVLGSNQNVRIEIDDFLTQLPIESGHDRNHKDQHGHAELNADDRDQRDDGKKCALRFQIPQRQEKTKRKLQLVLSVAANLTGFNRGRSAGFVRLALPRAPLVLPA